ncbi:MAG: MmgE/PrpD family protein [Sphingobium sp.]|nr:MmgE/PrpD family protein [Sphingobium sp.]
MKSAKSALAVNRRGFVTGAVLGASAPALPAMAQFSTQNTNGGSAIKARQAPGVGPEDGGVTGLLSSHIVRVDYTQIDAKILASLKLRLLDLIGCAIGGTRGEGMAALAATVADSGKEGASVLGTGRTASVREAAMANAVLARAYDFEVMHVVVQDAQVPSHHSPTTVMSALGLAEQTHADGRAFVTALSVGDDLAARTLAASGIDFNDGWDGAPLHSTMAAAAIAARFLGLDTEQTRQALGMAADQLSGTVQSLWDGGGAWKVQQGTAARNGIYSAELAKAGWSGMSDALLAPCGFYRQYTPGCARPELLTADLGKIWYGETYFKPWPSCAANHPTIESAIALRQRTGIAPADIEKVRIYVQPHVLKLFIAKPLRPGPSPHSQANFNLKFACATALLRGNLRQDDYEPQAMADPALHDLMARTELLALPTGQKGVIVEVTHKNGQISREALPGRPRHYADVDGTTSAEVEAKFRQQVAFAGNVPTTLADQIVRRVAVIEQEKDMASFVALLAQATRFPKGR